MEYGVEELARAAGVRVDTVRFYQARGLLLPPRRAGRRAIYSGAHLARLRRIRTLQQEGLPLDVIRRVLGERRAAGALARALRAEQGGRSLTRAELASESGGPEALARRAGGGVGGAGGSHPPRGESGHPRAGPDRRRGALHRGGPRAGARRARPARRAAPPRGGPPPPPPPRPGA